MVKIVFISDTHGHHDSVTVEPCDIVVHCGDGLNTGKFPLELQRFTEWFANVGARTKIYVPGNHDRLLDYQVYGGRDADQNIQYVEQHGIHVLIDREVKVQGLTFYGTPWTPSFGSWSFNIERNSQRMWDVMSQIPQHVDVLVTHGPPQGKLDTSGAPYNEPLLGCEVLSQIVTQRKPLIHAFGHIHGSYGMTENDTTTFINASVLDEQYQHHTNGVVVNIEVSNTQKPVISNIKHGSLH